MFLATIASLAAVQLTVQNMGNHSNRKTLEGGKKKCFWAKKLWQKQTFQKSRQWREPSGELTLGLYSGSFSSSASSSPSWEDSTGFKSPQESPRQPWAPPTHNTSRHVREPYLVICLLPLLFILEKSQLIISTIFKKKKWTKSTYRSSCQKYRILCCGNKVNPDYSHKLTKSAEQNLKRVALTSPISQSSATAKRQNVSLTVGTHIVVVVLDGLPREVEHGPGHDALADEMADFKVCGEESLRVFVLKAKHFWQNDPQDSPELSSLFIFAGFRSTQAHR